MTQDCSTFQVAQVSMVVVDAATTLWEHLVAQPFLILLLFWNCETCKWQRLWESRKLKELEHRILGWKVLILKYDFGKSLSKEMWCKMADTKKMSTYFKRWKMHVIWGKSFLCLWTRKWFSSHNEWYIGHFLVCANFSSKLAHGTYCLCSITELFRLLGIV